MAKWNTFKWSDGTKWADGLGVPLLFTSFIDHHAFRVSVRITHTAAAGSTTTPVVMAIMAETGVRSQLPDHYVAFIDQTDHSQYISVKVFQTFNPTALTELTTEADEILCTESGIPIGVGLLAPFTVDKVHILASQRSRRQPVR